MDRSSECGGSGYGNYFKLVLRENIQNERERARESFLLTTFPLIPESGRLLKGGRLFRVRSPEDSTIWFGFGVSSAVAVE